jgi:hypothetical protein
MNFHEDAVASQCLNKPRTVPKSRTGLGKRRAGCSRKVRTCKATTPTRYATPCACRDLQRAVARDAADRGEWCGDRRAVRRLACAPRRAAREGLCPPGAGARLGRPARSGPHISRRGWCSSRSRLPVASS